MLHASNSTQVFIAWNAQFVLSIRKEFAGLIIAEAVRCDVAVSTFHNVSKYPVASGGERCHMIVLFSRGHKT